MTDRSLEPAATSPQHARLAVVGSPIAHSLSPRLHGAAYRVLGLAWTYSAVETSAPALPGLLDGFGPEWRGLSVTMPLKRTLVPLLDGKDRLVELTGVANTLLFDGGQRLGFNTDVVGIVRALVAAGVHRLSEVMILGGGATAASALVASSELGAKSARFWLRNPERADAIRDLAETLEMTVEVRALNDIDTDEGEPDVVFSTLPNGAMIDLVFSRGLRETGTLFDVAYDPWPSTLARPWLEAGGRVIPGIEMLIHQALIQVRIFVSGDPLQQLPHEDEIFAAMRASVSPI